MGRYRTQSGSSLIVVVIMLAVISLIGIISARMSVFGERAARNDRDRQIAFQSAEAALLDAELDIFGPNPYVGRRVCDFQATKLTLFDNPDCGSGAQAGMCATALPPQKPGEAWQRAVIKTAFATEVGVDATHRTVEYGQFTGNSMLVGGGGITIQRPRYMIEPVDFVDQDGSKPPAYTVTALGFGTRKATQVMLQIMVVKPSDKPGAACS